MQDAGWHISNVATYGPAGLSMKLVAAERTGSIILTEADYPDHNIGAVLHASIAFHDSDPTYADLAILHRAVFGRRRYAYQLFVPQNSHVNIHEHALHLWGRVDGKPMMPDFGAILGTI
jgi:hypothetical protein